MKTRFVMLSEIFMAIELFKAHKFLDQEIYVDVAFVAADVMADLHLRFMGLPGPTDVLSFPLPGNGYVETQKNYPLRKEPLGEIVICPEFISGRDYAERQSYGVERAFIHGLLHLVGYSHDRQDEKAKMRCQESRLLSMWIESV